MTRKILVLFLVVSQCGCATIFHGTKDNISVRSEEPDTKIFIDEEYVGKNSAVHQVRKKGDHEIRVSKEGCADKTFPIPYSFDGTTLLGIFLDAGLISILIIDGVVNGAWSSASQTNFVLTPDWVHLTS